MRHDFDVLVVSATCVFVLNIIHNECMHVKLFSLRESIDSDGFILVQCIVLEEILEVVDHFVLPLHQELFLVDLNLVIRNFAEYHFFSEFNV